MVVAASGVDVASFQAYSLTCEASVISEYNSLIALDRNCWARSDTSTTESVRFTVVFLTRFILSICRDNFNFFFRYSNRVRRRTFTLLVNRVPISARPHQRFDSGTITVNSQLSTVNCYTARNPGNITILAKLLEL